LKEAEGRKMNVEVGRKAVHETRFRGSVPPDPCDRNREADRKREVSHASDGKPQEADEERKRRGIEIDGWAIIRRGGRETVEDRDGSEKRRSF